MPTWTTPRTWVTAETVTAAQLNNHVRDNLDFLHSKDRVHVYRAAAEGTIDSTWEPLNWTSESFDTNTMHDNATNNSRLKCNSDGVYLCVFKINFDSDTDGIRKAMIRKNAAGSDTGGTDLGTWVEDGLASGNTTVAGSRLVPMNSTDYVELFAYQTAGNPLDVLSGAATSFFQLMQLAG